MGDSHTRKCPAVFQTNTVQPGNDHTSASLQETLIFNHITMKKIKQRATQFLDCSTHIFLFYTLPSENKCISSPIISKS